MTEQTLAALAGPDPGHAALIRANAALAVAKAATLAALELGGGTLVRRRPRRGARRSPADTEKLSERIYPNGRG